MPGQVLEFPLTGGVDQHTDARKLPPVKLLTATNVQQPKLGRLSKRYGTHSIGSTSYGAPLNTPVTLGLHGSEVLALERSRVLSYLASKDTWSPADTSDHLPDFYVGERCIAQGPTTNLDPDVAYCTSLGLVCHVWAADGATVVGGQNIYATIYDDATGGMYSAPTVVNVGTLGLAPRVICVGTTFIVGWYEASGKIVAVRLDASSGSAPAWSATSNLSTTAVVLAANAGWDMVPNGANFTFAYESNSGTANQLSVVTLSSTFGAVASQLNIAAGDTHQFQSLCLNIAGSTLWIAFGLATATFPQIQVITLNATTLAIVHAVASIFSYVVAEFVHNIGILDLGNGSAVVTWTAEIANDMSSQVVTSALVPSGPRRITKRLWLQSRPFLSGGKAYALAAMSTSLTFSSAGDVTRGTYYLVDLRAYDVTADGMLARPVAAWGTRVCPESGGRLSFTPLSGVVADAAGNLRTVGSRISKLSPTNAGTAIPRFTVYDLTLTVDMTTRQSAELGGLTYLAGGIPCWYDGKRAAEVSFLNWPYASNLVPSNSGGSLANSATYQYAIIFMHYDNAGNVHRSVPHIVSAATGAGDNTIAIDISWLNLTMRQTAVNNHQKVTVEIYRTKASTSGDGSTFRRLTPEVALASGVGASSAGTLQNDPSSLKFTYTDKASDTSLNSQPLLYTTGGLLENVNPPSARLVCSHRSRIFLAGMPNGKEIWASKLQTNGEAPGFSEGLTIYVDDGGDITALQSMDDKLVIFKGDRLFIVTGRGPDDAGQNSDWSDPIRVQSTVGATSPYTVTTPIGVVFRSAVGISLLGRDLAVNPYWGAAIEDQLAAFPVVCGMLLHPTLPEIRILLRTATDDAGCELRYDYRHDAWFTAVYANYDASVIRAVVNRAGTPTYIGHDGSPFVEDPTRNKDDALFVPMTMEFAPVATAGPQGYQTIRSMVFLGDRYTDHDVTVAIAYDDEAYTDTVTIPAADSAAWPAYQFEYSPPGTNKCERFKVRLSDAFTTGTMGTGKGFALSSIGFDVEPKAGPNRRLPAAQRY